MILRPCPIVGCKSLSNHHWHFEGDPAAYIELCSHGYLCQNIEELARCYSRALVNSKPVLMLSVETVAAMIRSAEDLAYRRGWEDGWNDFDDYL